MDTLEKVNTIIDMTKANKEADVMMNAMNITAILIAISFIMFLGVIIGGSLVCG